MQMQYTRSDLQLSEISLYYAIIQVARELKKNKKNELCKKLLSNLNTSDNKTPKKMIDDFQCLLVNSVAGDVSSVLDVTDLINNKERELRNIIMRD
tara:strand:- start:578 stop:865 length:288 start_codon:yes stop_codon:yes gene_type:complete